MQIFRKSILFFNLIITFSFLSSAQIADIIQIKGIVVNIRFEPVSFSHILVKNKKTGTLCDENGKFDFFSEKGDTLQFSCIGYKKSTYFIPTNIQSRIYYLVAILKNDTTVLPEVIILPWKNYKQFSEIFIATKIPESDIDRAEKNIKLMQYQMLLNDDDMPSAPGSAYNLSMQQRNNKLSSIGRTKYSPLLNYVAWAQFLDYLANGKFKREKKNTLK